MKKVKIRFDDLERVLNYFGTQCHFDHHGYCQEHTLSDDCFIPRLVKVYTKAKESDADD